MLGNKVFCIGLLMLIPGIATLAYYFKYGKDIERKVEWPILTAAESDDAAKALVEIRGVVKYCESEGLTTGDITKWYVKLKNVEKRLEAANGAEATKLDKENALLYLRVNLMKGDEVSYPDFMSVYPNELPFAIMMLISCISGIFGIIFLIGGVINWDREF